MGKWTLGAFGGSVVLGDFASWETARSAAEEALAEASAEGCEPPPRKTTWSHGTLTAPDGESEDLRVAIEPEEPDCSDRDGHEWVDDGGPWGSGGGVRLRSVCRLCGLSIVTDTWATDPHDGSQGHDATEYLAPGEDGYSASWPEQLARAREIARRVADECVQQAADECVEDPDQPGGWTGGDPDEWAPLDADMAALSDALGSVPLVAMSAVEDTFLTAFFEAAERVSASRRDA